MMSRGSITEWYGILYDTMIGFAVPPYTKTKKRKAVESERFYYFDVGLVRFLLGLRDIVDTQTEYGKLFLRHTLLKSYQHTSIITSVKRNCRTGEPVSHHSKWTS